MRPERRVPDGCSAVAASWLSSTALGPNSSARPAPVAGIVGVVVGRGVSRPRRSAVRAIAGHAAHSPGDRGSRYRVPSNPLPPALTRHPPLGQERAERPFAYRSMRPCTSNERRASRSPQHAPTASRDHCQRRFKARQRSTDAHPDRVRARRGIDRESDEPLTSADVRRIAQLVRRRALVAQMFVVSSAISERWPEATDLTSVKLLLRQPPSRTRSAATSGARLTTSR
jgi:hypothetical protein